jgi:hypothetical protein
MKHFYLFLFISFFSFISLSQLSALSLAPSGLLCQLMSHPELSAITSPNPEFGWIVNSASQGDYQEAYQIMVATSADLLKAGAPDMWNNGWSHAWSASPAHIIPRKIMGIEPAEPGFGKINIRPHPGKLPFAQATVPTIRGGIRAGFTQVPGKSFTLDITIPVNTTAIVYLPVTSGKCSVTVDGKKRKCSSEQGYVVFDNVVSGTHLFLVEYELEDKLENLR